MNGEWISVDDLSRAPKLADEYDEYYGIVTDGSHISGGAFMYHLSEEPGWYAFDDFCGDITHWMPSPPLPPISKNTLLKIVEPCTRYHDCPLVNKDAKCNDYTSNLGLRCQRFAWGIPDFAEEGKDD